MTDSQMWSLIVGFLAPLVVAVVEQQGWTDRARALTAFAFSVVAGTGTVWLTGNLGGRSVVSCVLLVAVTSMAAYKGLWKPTAIAPRIEAATSRRTT